MAKLKTKEELLASFKKANKERKATLANRAGFDTPEEYLDHLLQGVKREALTKKKVTIHNVNILDTSASMGQLMASKLANAIKGIKNEQEELSRDQEVEYTHTLVTFHSVCKTEFWKVPFSKIPHKQVTNHWGNTALFDSLYEVLSKLKDENNEDDRVLVKIFTDGGENASILYGARQVQNLIDSCKELGMTITFVGTERDVRYVERILNIDHSNTLVHDNTMRGVAQTFSVNTTSTRSYATKAAAGATKDELLVGFYKQATEL